MILLMSLCRLLCPRAISDAVDVAVDVVAYDVVAADDVVVVQASVPECYF